MTKRQFVTRRRAAWRRFEQLLDQLDTRSAARLNASEMTEFSRLFRELCYDLSLIRSRDWGRTLVSYINDLVSRGHNAFYSAPPGTLGHVTRFLAVGFPQVFRRNLGYFLAASALFFLPLAITWAIVQYDPSLAHRILPEQMLKQANEMYKPETWQKMHEANKPDERRGAFGDQRSGMFGFYVQHNVSIALDAFGRGILFGVGTVYTLLSNGIALGTIFGYIVSQGNGPQLLSFAVSHGSFELTAIAVAGGAGLMLGNALIHPGQRTRLEALRHRGLEAIQIACGSGVMLVVAAVIEAFWSPADIPHAVKYSVGGLLWVLVFVYLSTAGRWGDQT
ncbi:MAG: stage II sporulation protein M [Planctomycetales bacterium]